MGRRSRKKKPLEHLCPIALIGQSGMVRLILKTTLSGISASLSACCTRGGDPKKIHDVVVGQISSPTAFFWRGIQHTYSKYVVTHLK